MPGAREPRAFFARWVRKEALLKAHGTGLALPPAQVFAGWEGEDLEATSLPENGIVHGRNLSAPLDLAVAIAAGRPVAEHLWWLQ